MQVIKTLVGRKMVKNRLEKTKQKTITI